MNHTVNITKSNKNTVHRAQLLTGSYKSKRSISNRLFNISNISKNTPEYAKYTEFTHFVKDVYAAENTRLHDDDSDRNNIIKFYHHHSAMPADIAKLHELIALYTDKYELDNFTLDTLPEYHTDFLQKSREVYDNMVNGTHDIKSDAELHAALDKRLADFPNCQKAYPDAAYYKEEYEREIRGRGMPIKERCNNIIWSDHSYAALSQPFNVTLFEELVAQLTDINILKTFCNPVLYEGYDDADIGGFKSRILEYYGKIRRVDEYDMRYFQAQFAFMRDQTALFGKNIHNCAQFYKRKFISPEKESCSNRILWSSLFNNLVLSCVAKNSDALFPVMFILPLDTYTGIGKPFNFKDKLPRAKRRIFSGGYHFIGIINIIHKFNKSSSNISNNNTFANKYTQKNRNKYRGKSNANSHSETRFWTFFIFRAGLNIKRNTLDYLSGNHESHIILNINGQHVNYGDLFSAVPVAYSELNHLTQKSKMTCFLKTIHQPAGIVAPLLFMTPISITALTPLHWRIIQLLKLQHVLVEKNDMLIDGAPSYAFILHNTPTTLTA